MYYELISALFNELSRSLSVSLYPNDRILKCQTLTEDCWHWSYFFVIPDANASVPHRVHTLCTCCPFRGHVGSQSRSLDVLSSLREYRSHSMQRLLCATHGDDNTFIYQSHVVECIRRGYLQIRSRAAEGATVCKCITRPWSAITRDRLISDIVSRNSCENDIKSIVFT